MNTQGEAQTQEQASAHILSTLASDLICGTLFPKARSSLVTEIEPLLPYPLKHLSADALQVTRMASYPCPWPPSAAPLLAQEPENKKGSLEDPVACLLLSDFRVCALRQLQLGGRPVVLGAPFQWWLGLVSLGQTCLEGWELL